MWPQRLSPALALCVCSAAFAAPPSMNDYAQGVVVEPDDGAPLLELSLPDPVYQAAARDDLRDLRVFNADGVAVPHAFCVAPDASAGVVTEQSLPIFELKDGRSADEDNTSIEVQTAGGTQVNVRETASQTVPAATGRMHIIDARQSEEPLRAVQFDWASPDDASQVSVRVEASEDLDRWRSLVPASTLLRVGEGDQVLRRERIELPPGTYKYLRVQRVDGGPPLTLRTALGERVAAPVDIEPVWFMPTRLADDETKVLNFETARSAPVRFARVRPQADNSSLSITLQSRAGDSSSWIHRWSGETYIVVTGATRRESPPARFEATTDRYWRLTLPKDAEASAPPTVEFGYYPLRLRFLAQGPAPFTLAFGSRRAEPANPASCDGLLADVSAEERQAMVGTATLGEFKTLGGPAALEAPPKKTPMGTLVLWGVLVVGVGLLVGMALALLKRVRPEG